MSNNKQISIDKFIEAIMKHDKSFKEFYGAEIEQAKAMNKEEIENTYAEGYSEGYYRALELVEWKIKNELKVENNE